MTATDIQLPVFHTVAEVAAMARMSEATLRRGLAADPPRYTAEKRGRRWLFTREQALAVVTPHAPAARPVTAPTANPWGRSPRARANRRAA